MINRRLNHAELADLCAGCEFCSLKEDGEGREISSPYDLINNANLRKELELDNAETAVASPGIYSSGVSSTMYESAQGFSLMKFAWIFLLFLGLASGCYNANLIDVKIFQNVEGRPVIRLSNIDYKVNGIIEVKVESLSGRTIWHAKTRYWKNEDLLIGDESPFVSKNFLAFSPTLLSEVGKTVKIKCKIQYDEDWSAKSAWTEHVVKVEYFAYSIK